MKIDLNWLTESLNAAKEGKSHAPLESCDYVKEHIYQPLLRGEQVLFSELDFDAFCTEDLWELDRWIEETENIHYRLCRLNLKFCEAVPVSLAKRAYC